MEYWRLWICNVATFHYKSASKMDIVASGWLASVPYALAAALMVIVSYYSDKTQNRKGFVWVSLLIGAIAFLVLFY